MMSSMDTHTSDQAHSLSNDIIDIRSDVKELSLLKLLRTSLKSTVDGAAPSFPHLLLWDEEGLKGFEDITYLDDYYLTHNEIDLLEQHSHDIALKIKPNSMLIELGSGNLRKIKILLQALDRIGRAVDYYALDLNHAELQRGLAMVPYGTFQHIRCHGLLGTYDDARSWLEKCSEGDAQSRPKCVISLGSSISSFTRSEAPDFLSGFAKVLKSSSGTEGSFAEEQGPAMMIVGLDACTSPGRLDRAYNDPHGAWDRFILNGLKHANTLLGHDAFRIEDWTAEGKWNAENGCYERYLIPLKTTTFEGVCFKAGDKLFISHSCKYNTSEQAQLWAKARLEELEHWSTKDGYYGVHILSATKH